MPCDTRPNLTAAQKARMADAVRRLDQAINAGLVKVVVGASGSVAFAGWNDREGVSDLCAYRKLTLAGSAALRRAMARAEVIAGRRVDARALAAGVHSHDGGATWSTH